MSSSSVARGLLVPLLASGLLLLGPSAAAGPGYHQPRVGECRDYGTRAYLADSETSKPVSCDQKHTALTVAVLRVPRSVGVADPEKAFAAVGTRCYRAMFEALGVAPRKRAETAYSLAYFLPTKAERARGARWVRCDLVLEGGTKLQPLPDPLLPKPLDDSVKRCLLLRHGRALTTVCRRTHDFRVAGIVKLSGAYRTQRQFENIAVKRCPRLAGERFYFNYPSREGWQAGDKRITCSKRTTR